jgi:hypothetical protein
MMAAAASFETSVAAYFHSTQKPKKQIEHQQ